MRNSVCTNCGEVLTASSGSFCTVCHEPVAHETEDGPRGGLAKAENPYSSPLETDSDAPASKSKSVDSKGDTEQAENLRFTVKIVRGMSVFCGAAFAFSLFSFVMGFYYLGFYRGWTGFHTLTAVRGMNIPAFALLAKFSWGYASSLATMVDHRRMANSKVELHVERLTWVWLGIAFLAFCKICELLATLSVVFNR